MHEALVVEAVRSPMARRNKALKDVRADDLAACALKQLIERSGIDPGQVEDVIFGCATQSGEQGGNIGRFAALIADMPVEVPSVSLNRMCGSSLQSFNFAAQAIAAGAMDLIIAAGVESMTRLPMGSDLDLTGFNEKFMNKYSFVHQGYSAEMIAEKWGISREECDLFSFNSHMKAVKARREGRFAKEIFPVEVSGTDGGPALFAADETPREDTSLEKLASLEPVFKNDGMITAGNSSQISDGAAALLLASEKKAGELGLKPRARVVATAVVGVDPTNLMLTGPIPATRKVLQKAGLHLSDIDIYEVNEAFAPVVLAWEKELAADPHRVNPLGGAIALGHPLGASGARLMTTMINQLEDTQSRYGLVTMCIGLGMGIATVVERLP